MKILVFSDTHLEENFDNKKYLFLKNIIKKADRVIINGDFWEGYTTTFDEFINSSWNRLFPLLKEKKTVYIYGNHDRKEYSNRDVFLFCEKAVKRYSLKINKNIYQFEHGSRWSSFVDSFFGGKTPAWFVRWYNRAVNFFVGIFGENFFIIYKLINNRIKQKALKNIRKKSMYVFGHTHYGEIDLINQFANSGFINYGFGHYLMIDNRGLSLHQGRYNR